MHALPWKSKKYIPQNYFRSKDRPLSQKVRHRLSFKKPILLVVHEHPAWRKYFNMCIQIYPLHVAEDAAWP